MLFRSMEILRRSGIPVEGANAVVLGRSDIAGKPMALLLLHANATVTICHSKTRDLAALVRQADIVVAAIGRAAMVEPDWVRPGAAVIDVGINRVTQAGEAQRIFANFPAKLEQFREKGFVLVGDVHPGVAEIAGAIKERLRAWQRAQLVRDYAIFRADTGSDSFPGRMRPALRASCFPSRMGCKAQLSDWFACLPVRRI